MKDKLKWREYLQDTSKWEFPKEDTTWAAVMFPGYTFSEITLPPEADPPLMNPSIWIEGAARHVVVRQVNYLAEWDNTWAVLDVHGVFRTWNHYLRLNERWNTVYHHQMKDQADNIPKYDNLNRGFEDCRLFRWRGNFWISATSLDRGPKRKCEITLCRLNNDMDFVEAHMLRGYGHGNRAEKNWMPWVVGDHLLMVYSLSPLVVLEWDPRTGYLIPLHRGFNTSLDHLRGGSQVIAVNGRWFCVAHEVTNMLPDKSRLYLHRFVELEEGFRVKAVTPPFFFLRPTVEFCAGLGYDSGSEKLVASFGLKDRRPYLGFFDLAAIDKQLSPP